MASKALLIAAVLLIALYMYLYGSFWMSIILVVSAAVIAVSYNDNRTIVLSPFPEPVSGVHSPLHTGAHELHGAHGKTPLEKLGTVETMSPEFGMEPNILKWEELIEKVSPRYKGIYNLPTNLPWMGHDKLMPHAKIVPVEGKFEVEIRSSAHPDAPKIFIEDDIRVEPQHSGLKGGYDPMNIVKPRWRSKKKLWDTEMIKGFFPHTPGGHHEEHDDEHHH